MFKIDFSIFHRSTLVETFRLATTGLLISPRGSMSFRRAGLCRFAASRQVVSQRREMSPRGTIKMMSF